jgi:gliding motility-associated-like protein
VLNTTSAITNGSPANITFIPYPDVTKPATLIVVQTDNAIADGTATNSVRAHVVDNNGNAMPNQRVVFTIVSGEGTIVTVQPVLTDANGDAVITLVSNKAGFVTLTATVENKNIINGSPAKVRFTPDDVWVPRVFTPNGDGTNDVVRPIINGSFQFKFFSIYNRWGNQLFNSIDVNKGWDGKLKGVLQPNETYLWIIGGTDRNNTRVQKRGMVTLVR